MVPAYRAEATIGATISGALTQRPPVHEVVVVDDGSDDATAAVVAGHVDPRVRLVRQRNAGVAAARNRGIAEATGSHIAFCDADDMWLPGHIAACLAHLAPRVIVTTNAYWLFPNGLAPDQLRHVDGIPTPDRQRTAILEQNFVSTMSVFPTDLVDEIGGFDETLRHAEDWDFWLRAIFAGYRIAHQPRPLALYRWTDDSLSADVEAMDTAVRAVLAKVMRRSDLTIEEEAYLRHRLSGPDPRVLYRRAELAVREGRHREAAADYAAAAAMLPSERRLRRKSMLLRALPVAAGGALRRRLRRRDDELGIHRGHVR